VLAAVPTSAVAWNCPIHIKAAEDTIKRAETMKLGPEARAMIADAKRVVDEARKLHGDARAKFDHANAM